MSVKKVDPTIKSRFDYLVFLDIVVLICIGVIAGRPDGLAITFSAIIVAVLALVYRCTVRIKSRMSRPARRPEAQPKTPVETPVKTTAGRSSWLRESD